MPAIPMKLLPLGGGDRSWMDQAVCREVDPELFFPESAFEEASGPAVEICQKCPVRVECAGYGASEPWGIWGGISEYARRKHLRRRDHAATQPQGGSSSRFSEGGLVEAPR